MFLRGTVTGRHFEDGLRSTDKPHGANERNRSAQLCLGSLEVSVHVEGSFVCQQSTRFRKVRGYAACAVKQGTSARAAFATVLASIHSCVQGVSQPLATLWQPSIYPTPSVPESRSSAEGSVFWLPDQPSLHAFPAPMGQWLRTQSIVQLVPGYSDGLASELHRLPAGSQSLELFMPLQSINRNDWLGSRSFDSAPVLRPRVT